MLLLMMLLLWLVPTVESPMNDLLATPQALLPTYDH
jgi:hypothetical protein